MTPAVQVIQNIDAAAALFSAPRLRILAELAEPDTAAAIARRVGLPRQQVSYHVRELEHAGLVTFVEERRKGNCVERVVRAAARSYVVSPAALGSLGSSLGSTPAEQQDTFSIGYLVGLAARAIRDLAWLSVRAAAAKKRVSTMAMDVDIRFATAESRSAFAQELSAFMAGLVVKYHSTEGRSFRLIAGVYPAITSASTPEPGDQACVNMN
ncbi:MAG: helix-turn-helix domain-containing protein [Candidatus Sulfotelmatobacter sp.]|jgi:DNA-binding transcriptional ArsR family regulator